MSPSDQQALISSTHPVAFKTLPADPRRPQKTAPTVTLAAGPGLTCGRRYAIYPPVVESFAILGYLSDVNERGYSRDVGRSSIVNGQAYYQFGDTFCKDGNGNFVGVTSHTAAGVCQQAQPTLSEYRSIQPNGMVDSFIPLTASEQQFEADPANDGARITLWSFGGIAEDAPGAGRGWCWFERGEAYKNGVLTPRGTGIARVFVGDDTQAIYAHRPTDTLLFGVDEPRWGTFSTLVEDGWVYLWGHHNNKVMLARVRCISALNTSTYEFWDGTEYQSDPACAFPVFVNTQQGAVIPTTMFGPENQINYLFVGVSSAGDSKIMMGVSASLEGPFDVHDVASATGLTQGGYMYCIYPHPWAFREEDGELLVSWSEHWPGGVVAAKLKFKQGEEAPETTVAGDGDAA